MVHRGEADSLICGTFGQYSWHLNYINQVLARDGLRPQGALYAFPRLDPEVHEIRDDQQFALDLLRSEKILITHGSGFNLPTTDHFRVVTLPHPDDLAVAVERMGNFLGSYRQG